MEYNVHLLSCCGSFHLRQIFLKYSMATLKALPHPDRNEFFGLLKVRFLLNRISRP